ncbi:MAG: 2-oxoacid:ferredoxin oxidoreductase subunit beta, partial [Planctomycetota bacterium]
SPCAFAIGCESSFVARTVDMYPSHMEYTLRRAATHRGVVFVEIYQDCVTFNKGAFNYATDRSIRSDSVVELDHGRALIFGNDLDKGIRLNNNYQPEVVTIGQNGITINDLLIHDEKAPSPALAFLLSRLRQPELPEPIGVFRNINAPSYDTLLNNEINLLTEKKGKFDWQELLTGTDTWVVK